MEPQQRRRRWRWPAQAPLSAAAAAPLLLLLALLLAVGTVDATARRQMLQTACGTDIQMCSACTTVLPAGRVVCQRCQTNYAAVTRTIQGAKYIVQCVCPRGQYHDGDLGRCVTCPIGSFCTGGDFIDSPNAKLGSAKACSRDGRITTRATGAQSASACVAPAGYVISSFPQLGGSAVATPCGPGTYAPDSNRLSACVKCQAGLAEDPSDQLNTAGRPPRADVSVVCKVPPGKWYSQNVVKTCAAGLWRGGFVAFRNQSAATCSPCPRGITTPSAGATARANCSRVLAGYGLDIRSQAIIPGNASTFPLGAQDVASAPDGADQCGPGFYSAYNLCVACPYGTTTRGNASASVGECAIPPGYAVVGGTMAPCGDGTYRAGWLSWNSSAQCATCGANVNSTPVDPDEDPRSPGGLVRASPASCFIPAGWEVTYNRATAAWSARACPANTYGVSAPLYGLSSGLVQVPCKACPRGMTTLGATAVSDADACTNPAGYGYSSEGATPCAPGFWAAQDSKLPCAQCAPGRTTVDNPAQQTSALACTVMAGFGVSAADAAAAGANTTLQAALTAAPCDVGFYQPTNHTLNAVCVACAAGSTTAAAGATSCDTCVKGYGRSGGACAACDYGSYARAGDDVCSACPTTDFYDVGGRKLYTSNSTTTFVGASSSEFCVPLASHVAQDAGQLVALPDSLTTYATQPTLSACIASCPSTQCCLLTYTTGADPTNNCGVATLVPVASYSTPAAGKAQLLYKLPPAPRVAASSALVGSKVATTQIYAQCETPGATTAFIDGSIGTNLDAAGRRVVVNPVFIAAPLQQCKATCDASAYCWGVLWNGTHCSLRAAEDALRVVAFFVLPTAQGCAELDACSKTPCGPGATCADACLANTTANNRVCTCSNANQAYVDDVIGCQAPAPPPEFDACTAFSCTGGPAVASCTDIVGGSTDARGRTCTCTDLLQTYVDDIIGCASSGGGGGGGGGGSTSSTTSTLDFTQVQTDFGVPIGDYAGFRWSQNLVLAKGGDGFSSKLEKVAAFVAIEAMDDPTRAAQFAALGAPDVTLTLTRVRVGCGGSAPECSGLRLSLVGYDVTNNPIASFTFDGLTNTPADFAAEKVFAGKAFARVAFSVDACVDACAADSMRVALEALDVAASGSRITFDGVTKFDTQLSEVYSEAYAGLVWTNVAVQQGDGKAPAPTNVGYFLASGKAAKFALPPGSRSTLSLLGLKAAVSPAVDAPTLKIAALDADGNELYAFDAKLTNELLPLALVRAIKGATSVTIAYASTCDPKCVESGVRVLIDDLVVEFVPIL